MLSHERVWRAIDKLADSHDMTPSGLAKKAGLDSTTFNKSKRFAADGRPRWPSTESLSKIMDATATTLDEFMALVDQSVEAAAKTLSSATIKPRGIPLLGLAKAGVGGYFDEAGLPSGEAWEEVSFPDQEMGAHVYALEINGDSMLPLYRDGDRIIVSPNSAIRRGDRVVVKTRDGEVMAKILKRRTSLAVELASANPDHPDRQIETANIEWMARILWASQ